MPTICAFPGLGGRVAIPDYGGVAGTGPATFLNFPMTVSNNKPNADGEREGAIWIQTKNLLGEATKISIQDTVPDDNSEDNVLYFVTSSMKSIRMDIYQETGVWKPIETHISIGAVHDWLVGSLEDGSKIYLNLPKMYSKIGGTINIENAWYWHNDSWAIISEVGRAFFKNNLYLHIIGKGLNTDTIIGTLPFSSTDYSISITGEYIAVLNINRTVGVSYTNSNFSIYKKKVATFEKISNDIPFTIFGEVGKQSLITNIVTTSDVEMLATAKTKAIDLSGGYFDFFILEKDGDSYSILKTISLASITDYARTDTTLTTDKIPPMNSKLSVDEDFTLFSVITPPFLMYNSGMFHAFSAVLSYNGDDLKIVYKDQLSKTVSMAANSTDSRDLYNQMYTRVFDEFLCAIPYLDSGVVKYKIILTDGETVLDTYNITDNIYVENASYERIGKYGVVTYATKDTTTTGNYIMGLSYDRETLQFVSTGVPVRTADTISNPVDEVFPERQYLSHYSIQKDEALFTINGITLLMGGEAGANFDTETGAITPATTMMDQGVKVYVDTVSRSGQPNIYIGD